VIEASDIDYDQLIEEGSWVHLSVHPKMRRQTMIANFSGRKVTYAFYQPTRSA